MSAGNEIKLRPAQTADRTFLIEVYADSRAEELRVTGWSDQEKAAFCSSQFEAQDKHYRQHYPNCEYLVVEQGGIPVGRIYIDRRVDEIRIVDLALLTEFRSQGIGGHLMQGILDEAQTKNQVVGIHVEHDNPARRLYDRLGFKMSERGEVYDRWTWCPQSP